MNAHGVNFHARGMHCSGCEHIIEDSVGKVAGVQHVKAALVSRFKGLIVPKRFT